MTTYKRVPLEATEEQWGGLARDIMMAFDLGAKSPKSILEQLERMRCTWAELPQWLRDELRDPNSTSVLSKGTRCILIYRAMVEDAPLDVPTKGEALRSAADQLLNGTIIGSCTHDDNSLSEIADALPSDLSWAKQNLHNHVKLLRRALAKE